MPPTKIPTEAEEQGVLVQWLELNNLKFTAIPNSTYTKSWKQKMHNKNMGLRAGLPDLLVIVNNHLVFVEMKRIKKSNTTQAQKDWIEALNMCANVEARVCKGAEEAINFIKEMEKII